MIDHAIAGRIEIGRHRRRPGSESFRLGPCVDLVGLGPGSGSGRAAARTHPSSIAVSRCGRADRRDGRENTGLTGSRGRLPAGSEHHRGRRRSLDDRADLLAGRRDRHAQCGRRDVVPLARDLVPAGDADLLLRRRLLELRDVPGVHAPGREQRRVRPEPSRPIAPPVAGVPRRLGGRDRRDAPVRDRGADRPSAVGRRDAAPRHAAAGRDGALRPAVVPGRLPRGRGDRAGDDPPARAVRPVGAGRRCCSAPCSPT